MRSKLNSTIKCDINLQLSTLSTWVCCCKTYWLSEIAYIPLFLASQKVAGHPCPDEEQVSLGGYRVKTLGFILLLVRLAPMIVRLSFGICQVLYNQSMSILVFLYVHVNITHQASSLWLSEALGLFCLSVILDPLQSLQHSGEQEKQTLIYVLLA